MYTYILGAKNVGENSHAGSGCFVNKGVREIAIPELKGMVM